MALLHQRCDMLHVMEEDLINKISAAITTANIIGTVHGVYSVDDLEAITESELCGGIAFGVGYQGCTQVTDHPPQNNVDRSNAAKMGDFFFVVIIAAPVTQLCSQRIDAMSLLTTLRLGILGKQIGDDRVQRTWQFVKEKPEIRESTDTMLFYSQVWRVVLPMTSM